MQQPTNKTKYAKRRSRPRISLRFHAQLCFLYVNCQAILYSGNLRYPSSNSYTSSVLFKLPECIISLKTESIFDSRKYNSLMIFILKYQLSFLGTKEPIILHTDFLTENYSNLISENLFFVFVPTIFEYCENKVWKSWCRFDRVLSIPNHYRPCSCNDKCVNTISRYTYYSKYTVFYRQIASNLIVSRQSAIFLAVRRQR